jgi:hypothetical protein
MLCTSAMYIAVPIPGIEWFLWHMAAFEFDV